MTRHRKALSLTLALALVLSLSLTSASAVELTYDNAQSFIDVQINLDVDTEVFIDEADAVDYYNPYWGQTSSNTGYFAFEWDTSITVTYLPGAVDSNTDYSEPFVWIALFPFRQQADGSYVSTLQQDEYGNDVPYILHTDGTFAPVPADAIMPENYSIFDGGMLRGLAPGESVTFTIPFDELGDDQLYEMQAILSFNWREDEMSGWAVANDSWRYFRILLDEETVAQRRAGETPAEETPAEPTEDVVMPTNQALQVNGEAVTGAQVYNINGSNYFKLRDVAALLNGTGSQFALAYDAAARQIVLTTGEAYTPDGSELSAGEDQSATAVRSSQSLTIDGESASLTAYNIGGNNYFMLRDLGEALGFEVDYDAAARTMIINSK